MEYYRQPPSDTLHALDSTPDGLTPAQAAARLARDGRNVLTEPPKPSLVKRFFQQLADPMILVLLAAALISAITSAYAHESFADVIIILVVVIINAVLGVYQERKAEQAKATTGDAAVDSLILRGQQLLEQIRSENDRLPEPEISEQIDTIESIANQIFKAVIEQPKKAPQIRRFMDYYLPTTLKMLVAFRRMEEGNVTGESADNARQRIRESLDMVIEAFNKQLARLYEDDALDITTDIDVLETMLKQDGLIDSGLRTRTSTGEEK